MKKVFYIFIVFYCISSFSVYAQEISLKYGKITQDELLMEKYDKDSTASAIVIYEDGYSSYLYNMSSGFQVMFDLKKKIKILKQDGTDEADISIPFYYKNNSEKETISGLEAYSYNMENGKVVKTKLEKKYIFDEDLGNNRHLLKFSIPNVKAGSVIEYKYRKSSEFTTSIPDWNTQSDIPVMNSYYEVLIPEYYLFHVDAAKGYEKITVTETKQSQSFNLGHQNGQPLSVTSISRLIKISAKDMPALKNEPHVWNVNDFTSGVRFEFRGTQFPNDFTKSYTNTWEALDKTLFEKTDFGTNLKLNNPYKNEVKAILADSKSEDETISKIYALIKEKIKWNELYAFYGNNAKTAIKEGIGNNAQINMVLISALKDAGIKASPVLMSRRSRGRIPYSYPSLDWLNTFVVQAETGEGKKYYMDGSAVHNGLNVLPPDLQVDRARLLSKDAGEKWVDLTNITKNQYTTFQKIEFKEDGSFDCQKQSRYINQYAYRAKTQYYNEKDSIEYFDKLQDKHNISINKVRLNNLDNMSNSVTELIEFTKKYDSMGDYLYINPFIFTHIEQNPFIQSERKLPIEFGFPYSYNVTTSITIPEGYAVDEVPESISLRVDDGMTCLYMIEQKGNTVSLSYKFEQNQLIFPQTEYEMIKEFFGKVANKNTELIVLKKI